MADIARNQDAARERTPIEILRQRRGGVSRELMERNRRQAADRRRIVAVLQSGPTTVPEVARETHLPSREVFWHLMAMKKYGKLVEGEERESYFEYVLAEKSEKTETAS